MAPNTMHKKTMASIRAPVRGRSSSSMTSPTPSITSIPTAGKLRAMSPSNPGISGGCNNIAIESSKLRRPTVHNNSTSTSSIPTQKTLHHEHSQLTTSRIPPSNLPRPHTDSKSDMSLSPPRPIPTTQSTRSYSSSPSPSPSPRLTSTSRVGDHSKPTSSLSLSLTGPNSSSMIAKPISRTPKTMAIKPPSIVTRPYSGKSSSLPPIAPSPKSAQTLSTSPSSNSAAHLASTLGTSPKSYSPSPPPSSSMARSKNRLQSGIDSACFMTRSGSVESLLVSSPSSSASSTPTMSSTPTLAGPGSETSILSYQQKPISRRPSAAELGTAPSTVQRSTGTNDSIASVSKSSSSILALNESLPLRSNKRDSSISEATTLCTTSPETKSNPNYVNIVQCQCPPRLEFPENVKNEMKREELEHRHRESELYSKIIELQIENANLKGDKEALNRVISNREKMLMEIRVQLQAMEFFCRENNIKVDIEMCSDEVIENWCFKESDEVYQRILFTTQELLRTGSKCLEENTTVGRSSLNLQSRSTRTSSTIPRVTSMDQSRTSGDALLFKETSRPGTLKLDLQSLLRSEQDFDSAKNNRSTVSHSNLAEIDAGIVERDGRRAIDGGDDRSSYFHASIDDEDDGEYDSSDDDGDESQESEFEELGEDMIKYVELQPSMGPRRNSKSSTYSRMNTVSPYNDSSASTPDMSANVLNKTLWSGAARRSGATTPLQNSSFHHQMQLQPRRSGSANRNSGSSFNSNGSLFEDYCARPMESADTLSQTSGAPIGLGIRGNSPSLQRVSMEKFLSTPPSGALPPILAPQYSPALSSSSPPTCQYTQTYSNRSIFSNNSSPVISSQDTSMIMKINKSYNNRNSNSSMTRPMPPPPPMLPLPPLPTYNRLSHPEQAKQDLRESRRPRRGRTSSQEFTIENMGPQAHSKLLAQDLMHRGHQRQISV